MADSDDVASFLAQRKAKKAGGARFKTFSASAALIAEGQGENGDALGQGDAMRGGMGASAAHAVSSTLVQGDWMDEEGAAGPSRLLASGNVIDLESMALEEKQKAKEADPARKSAYPVRQPPPDLAAAGEPQKTTFSAARKAQMDFPSLGSAKDAPPSSAAGSAPGRPAPPSVWGNRPSSAAVTQQPSVPPAGAAVSAPPQQQASSSEPSAAAADAKPGVWRPKSQGGGSSMSSSNNIAPAPVQQQRAPAASSAPSSSSSGDGLRKSANPWRPRGAAD